LGLAVVQGILGSIGGAIRVSSTPGVGSTFEVLLPCAAQPAVEVRRQPAESAAIGAKVLYSTPA
jgi:K+-sensing histidine kinase KdpD